MIEKKEVTYGYPNGNPDYKPFVELTQMLLDTRETTGVFGKKRDKELYWRDFMNNSCVKKCLREVENAFEKQFGKK